MATEHSSGAEHWTLNTELGADILTLEEPGIAVLTVIDELILWEKSTYG